MRRFFSGETPCPAKCMYCFSKWDKLYKRSPSFEQEILDSQEIILYPCCDSDFFSQHALVDNIKKYAMYQKKIYVSVSSKLKPSDKALKQLLGLHNWLISERKGFVKFAVSISNRTLLDEIEPGTMTYNERLNLASFLYSKKMPLSLTIKPVLPFVPPQEYYSIITDFNPYTLKMLIGGLYVDKSSSFYSNYLRDRYLPTKRSVMWLEDHPQWDYIEDANLMQSIKIFAKHTDVDIFDSDVALIKSFIEEAES